LELIKERAGNMLEPIAVDNNFLNRTQMAQQQREMIDKWDYMKVKSFFCTTKEMVTRLKRQPTKSDKIFASYTSNKGLIIRIYRELKNLNSQNINDPIKKWAKELNQDFSKEEVQMAKKHMKKCSTYLAIKEMQMETILRFHLIPITMITIKNKYVGRKRPHTLLVGM
jgi:hypothetical protein